MSTDDLSIEDLRLQTLDLYKQNQDKEERINKLELELYQLRQLLVGHRSEKTKTVIGADQATLFEQGDVTQKEPQESDHNEKEEEEKLSKTRKKNNQREKIPPDLPRHTIVLEPEVDTSQMKLIGTVVHEKLEYVPPKIIVHRIERNKYVDADGQIHVADFDDPLPKCNIGPSLAAHVAVSKYINHLPLYRQSKMFKSHGIRLARSTLGDSVMRISHKLEKIYQAMIEKIMSSEYIMADESGIPVLNKDKPGSALKGCMLVMYAVKEKVVVFDYTKTKHKEKIVAVLAGFSGHLQVDGNVSYETPGNRQDVTLHNCLVHARRYFTKAYEYDSKRSKVVLDLIAGLYVIEKHMATKEFDHVMIKAYRKRHSKPLLQQLYCYCRAQYRDTEHKDPFQKALAYTLKRWTPLTRFLSHGKFELDTNLLENEIRPMAVGRRNYLFCGSHRGARAAGIFYSFFATCRKNSIDPMKWLEYVIRSIDNHPINSIHELIPDQDFRPK